MAENTGQVQYNDRAERVIFGLLLIGGYIGLVVLGAAGVTDTDARQLIRDALLVLGPVIGGIATAIWKTNSVERQQAATLQTLAASAAAPVATTTTTRVEKPEDTSHDVRPE
jgi:peptidoglycan/LPS O-acetylase OafA/YrhL